jgi:hypothetical protein
MKKKTLLIVKSNKANRQWQQEEIQKSAVFECWAPVIKFLKLLEFWSTVLWFS